jgi:hypothetical protein
LQRGNWIEQAYNSIIRHYSKKQDQPNVLATYEAALENCRNRLI